LFDCLRVKKDASVGAAGSERGWARAFAAVGVASGVMLV
jgi:hypothetical protein